MPSMPATEASPETTEAALANARNDFRTLIDRMPIGVVINRGGRWIYVNPAFAQMLGRPSHELVGRGPSDFVHPDDSAELTEHMWTLLAGPSEAQTYERRFLRPNGEPVVVEASPTHLADFEGQAAILLLARDVTEQKRMLAQQLVAERMVSVGTLAAGVAHEINNPLACVMSNLQVALEAMESLRNVGPPALRDLEQALLEAYEGAERVRKIVRGMQTLSRGDDDVRHPIDLHRVIEASVGLTQNEIRHRARLVRDFGSVPLVIADEARLGQVLINLLANAAHAIREGDVERNEIRIVTRTADDGAALVEVHDTGHGIPAHIVPRLFDPFFTTKEVGAGLGLGLSICHGIVTSMGGQIDLETTVGKGTCFRVKLPAAPASSVSHVPAPAVARSPVAGRARVLVVDDDPLVRKGLRRVLSDHDITLAESGRDARSLLRVDASFDLIVCDLIMPEMSGMDLYHELSRTMPELLERIVFTTGGAFTPAARAFLDQVPNRRMHKPFDTERLRTLADECARLRGQRGDLRASAPPTG
jgi:two-component system, cell cycle sensor histidine kinase and response regulator CckA